VSQMIGRNDEGILLSGGGGLGDKGEVECRIEYELK